jgi:hypothetical protein
MLVSIGVTPPGLDKSGFIIRVNIVGTPPGFGNDYITYPVLMYSLWDFVRGCCHLIALKTPEALHI